MPLSNVEIHQLGWFALVAIFAVLAPGKVFGFACPPIAVLARAVLLGALPSHLDSGLYSGRR